MLPISLTINSVPEYDVELETRRMGREIDIRLFGGRRIFAHSSSIRDSRT